MTRSRNVVLRWHPRPDVTSFSLIDEDAIRTGGEALLSPPLVLVLFFAPPHLPVEARELVRAGLQLLADDATSGSASMILMLDIGTVNVILVIDLLSACYLSSYLAAKWGREGRMC